MKAERIEPFDKWEITNPDFYLIVRYGKRVAGQRAERVINKIAKALVISVAVLITVHVLVAVLR